MIIDRIENLERYCALGNKFTKALEYLKNNELVSLPVGKYEILQDEIFMLVMDAEQKNTDRFTMEGHRKYIDLQYWVNGSELMGFSSLQQQDIVNEYDNDKDFASYTASGSFIRFSPGMFAIYFPTDLHTAVTDESYSGSVKKVVFKIKVD